MLKINRSHKKNKIYAVSLLFILMQFPSTFAAEAKKTSSSGSSPSQNIFRLEGAYGLMSGETGNSFAGASSYAVVLGLEGASGTFRFFGNFQLDYLPDSSLELAGTTTTINYSAVKLALGVICFPMTGAGMQPFLAAAGSYARGGVNVSPETPELSNFFRTNLYGYEVSVGVDFKGSPSGQARFRIRATYSSEFGKFDNITAFKSNAIKLSAGFGL